MTGPFRVTYRRNIIDGPECYGSFSTFDEARSEMDRAVRTWNETDKRIVFAMSFDGVCIYRTERTCSPFRGRYSSYFQYSHDWGELSRKDAHYVIIDSKSSDVVKDCGPDLESALCDLETGSGKSVGFFTEKMKRKKLFENSLAVFGVLVFMALCLLGLATSRTWVDTITTSTACVMCVPIAFCTMTWAYREWCSKSYINLNVANMARLVIGQ